MKISKLKGQIKKFKEDCIEMQKKEEKGKEK